MIVSFIVLSLCICHVRSKKLMPETARMALTILILTNIDVTTIQFLEVLVWGLRITSARCFLVLVCSGEMSLLHFIITRVDGSDSDHVHVEVSFCTYVSDTLFIVFAAAEWSRIMHFLYRMCTEIALKPMFWAICQHLNLYTCWYLWSLVSGNVIDYFDATCYWAYGFVHYYSHLRLVNEVSINRTFLTLLAVYSLT